MEKPTKAAEVLRRALSLAPSDAEIYLELGNVMEDLGNFEEYRVNADKAKDLFEASVDIDGAYRANWDLGWANYKLGRWAESAAASARAVELNPEAAVPRYNLGLALLRQGEVDKATEAYRAALALDDQSRLHQDGILDLIEAMKQVPDLPGAAGILSELQAHAERIRTRRRARHKASPAQ
jgi:tetratricopeptide (TPR) repeat protein